ncbi:hypothetical protein [Colwellia sp. MEBiC06753]
MTNNQQQTNTRSGRKHFIMVCVAFILPIVLAKFALEQQWFNYGVTNQGTLLDEPVSLSQLSLEHIQPDKHWLLVFNQPQDCQKSCIQILHALTNTYTALGSEKPRVTSVLLAQNHTIEDSELSQWQVYDNTTVGHPALTAGTVFIVDPLGNVVLTHPYPASAEQLPAYGKAILADLKKLLKYSRIG